MKKSFIFLVFLFCLPLLCFASVDSYLVEIGEIFFNQGRVQEARAEFKKALQVNPDNQKAKNYLARLRQGKIEKTLDQFSSEKVIPKKEIYRREYRPVEPPSFDLDSVAHEPWDQIEADKKKSYFYLEGDYQLSLGVESGDLIWKRANPDLNEANWRLLWDGAYNRNQNTFDPAIFSQLRLKSGYDSPSSKFGFHSYLDISPWSFVGKSDRVRVYSDGYGGISDPDSADIQLKYWSNTRHIISETIYSNLDANIFNLGEQKVRDGWVSAFSREGFYYDWGIGPRADTFEIPELKIKREFWPLRELWFDFAADNINLRVFPAALQDQAYSSDSPLKLTNRHNWWQSSPWITEWKPGNLNPEVEGGPDFYKGYWDDALAHLTRNSAGERLTNLRGFSLNLSGQNTLLDFTAASPKNLWQDYDDFNTLNTALRGKYFYGDNLMLGFTHASKQGFDSGLDAFNHVWGFDFNYGLTDKTALALEAVTSHSEYDRESNHQVNKRGNTYHFNLLHASSRTFDKDFYQVRPQEKDSPFYRIKLSFTRMDANFDAALADYRYTRDDAFWSRHLTFRRPFSYDYFGLYGPALGWDDLYPFRIGDGIDSGRNVASLRWEAENIINQNLDLLFDIRDVRQNSGGLIENVSRLEGTYNFTPCLRLKSLGIYHYLPKTEAGVDPFMEGGNNRNQRAYYLNENIEAGKDPSLKTFSAGIEYDFFNWLSANFVWERSNDTTLAYGNFPRGLFEWSNVDTYTQGGNTYREQIFGLYNTDVFPVAPYPYYNIFKGGLRLEPLDNLELYLTYTHNEYNWAQIIDENMNHVGLEASYIINNKIGFYLRYVYARANNLYELAHNQEVVKTTHHNVFSEIKYRMDKESELVAQYGAGGYGLLATPTDTPFGGGVSALDTQHIFRLYYRRKF